MTELTIGIPANAANANPRSGHTVFLHQLLRAVADRDQGLHLRNYLKRPARHEFLDRRPTMSAHVLRESRLTSNRWMAPRIDAFLPGRRWETLALAPELLRRPPTLFVHVAHEDRPPLLRRPAVAIVYDLAFLHPEFRDHFSPTDLERLTRATNRSLAACRHVVSISAYTAGEIERFYAIPPERISVIHPGVERRFFAAAPGTRSGTAYVLALSVIQPRKFLPEIFRAFAACERSGLDAELLIVGRKGWRAEQELAAAAEASCRRWRYLGELQAEPLVDLVAGAAAFVSAGRAEGFGLPVLEAMAAGAPVVGARSGALPEVIGDAGLLYEPGDIEGLAAAITSLVRDEARRSELSARGRAAAQRFTWEAAAERFCSTLRAVASEAG